MIVREVFGRGSQTWAIICPPLRLLKDINARLWGKYNRTKVEGVISSFSAVSNFL